MKSSPMAPRRKSFGQKSEPKLFRCTGFGDCDMVFTRSEHLARHARKHTGEKPYKCVVPGCGRNFSRFDNMMQHTQTHNKPSNQKKDRRKSTSHIPSKKDNKHMTEFDKTTEFDRSNSIHPLSSSQWGSPQMSMISSRTLPLPRRMSYSHYPSPSSPMTTTFEPMPPPPALYYRRGSLQSTSSTSSSVSTEGRRRLSAADLQVPIQSFQEATLGGKDDETSLHPLAVVDISCDEYEALQGFSKFSSREQKNDSSDETDSDDVLPSIQPNAGPMLSAQVAAFRQNLMPIQESFQRPFKNQAM